MGSVGLGLAVAVLLDPAAHAGATYSLTGPEALTLDEVAATLSRAQRRPIVYEPETIGDAYASRAHYGAPSWQVDAWVSTYTAIAAGEGPDVTMLGSGDVAEQRQRGLGFVDVGGWDTHVNQGAATGYLADRGRRTLVADRGDLA